MTDTKIRIRPAEKSDLPVIIELFAEDGLHGSAPPAQEGEGDATRRPGSEHEAPRYGQPDPGHAAAFDAIDRDPNNSVYVAEVAGKVVGTFQLTFIRQLSYGGCLVAQIESVHVRASERSLGIGRAMMEWAILHSRERGALRVQLTSNVLRERAHQFYERLGFRATHKGLKLYLV